MADPGPQLHHAHHATPDRHDPKHDAEAQRGAGLAAVQAVTGTGEPAALQIGQLIQQHPAERTAILTWLHAHRGNAFVERVVADSAAKPGLPEGVEVKKVTASIMIPGKRKLQGDWKTSVVTRAPTEVGVEVSQTGVRVWFAPTLFVDATWPLQNAELYGAGINFASGKATADAADGHGLGSGMISIKDKLAETITSALEKGIAGTPIAKPGYNPAHDPDLAGTLGAITSHVSAMFPAGGGGDGPVATREMSHVSASATVASKTGGQYLQDGSGIQVGAGSELTLAALGAGTVEGLLGTHDVAGAARAANIQKLVLSAADLQVVSKGKPLVKLEELSLSPGGKITVDRMTLLGKAADARVMESGLSLIIGLIAAAGHDGSAAAGALQNAGDPKLVDGVTRALIEKELTKCVHQLVLQHRRDIPGMDLAELLKIS